MFNLGDKVQVTSSGKIGTVQNVYPSGYWNMTDNEYHVVFDDGSAAITIVGKLLELIESVNKAKCECGVKFARSGGKHSSWCELSKENE